jgi:3-hydroxyacyl-[acyl-carrier-protein] dehydratase
VSAPGAWTALAADALPHRAPALLVAATAEVSADGGRVLMPARGGRFDVLQLIEGAAQALAALAAARARAAPGPSAPAAGMLVALNHARAAMGAAPAGDAVIACRLRHRLGTLSLHAIAVRPAAGGDATLTAELSVIAQDGPAPMAATTPPAHGADAGHAMHPFVDAARALGARLPGPGASAALGGASAPLRFPPDLPVLAGHFPGRPLIPGVHLLAAMLLTAAPDARLAGLDGVKWRRPLLPGAAASVRTRWSRDGDRLRIDGQVLGADGECCAGRLEAAV